MLSISLSKNSFQAHYSTANSVLRIKSIRGSRRERHPAVLLFAHLSTVLPHHSYRMRPFLRKTSVIHDPCLHQPFLSQGGQRVSTYLRKHRLLTPGSIGHH